LSFKRIAYSNFLSEFEIQNLASRALNRAPRTFSGDAEDSLERHQNEEREEESLKKAEMSRNEKEQNMDETRDKVQNWLMSEGWQISEQSHPEMAWLIRAEDAGERKILVGQNRAKEDQILLEASVAVADEHRQKFESLPDEKRREILWGLRFRLLSMNVDFLGVAEPMQTVVLTQRTYLDGLTKDGFIQRFFTVRNAVIAVIWSIMQDLEDVEPPAESTEVMAH
jgi:hypothetical protein